MTNTAPQIFAGRGTKTISVIGCAAGRVAIHERIGHESHDPASRFFISIEGKLQREDALADFGGNFWWGMRKGEATKAANAIANKANMIARRIDFAKASTLKGADILLKSAQSDWQKLVGRYCAEVQP